MSRSLVWRLIAKDLYLYRWLIGGAAVAGLASLFIRGNDAGGYGLGIVLFITTIVALGIFIAMYGVLKERQDKSLLFVLSLPISTMQYTTAKISSSLIAFLIPWLLLLTTTVVLIDTFDDTLAGRIPYTVALMGFFLSNFCMLLALLMITGSERWAIAGIILTNMSISVYISVVGRLPGIAEHLEGAVAVWSSTILTILAIEAAVSVLSVALAFYVLSHKKDFI